MANYKEKLQVELELKDKMSKVLKSVQAQAKKLSDSFNKNFVNSFKNADKQADKMLKTLNKISEVVAGIGTISIGVVIGKGVKDFISLEEQLAKTASTGGFDKLSNEYSKIEEIVNKLGRETSKTSTEVAGAMEKMYLAGWNTEEVTNSIEDMIKFAEANSVDLVNVIDLVTDSTGATGLSIDDLSSFYDKLTKASTKANASVEEFLESTLKSGAGLKTINTSIDEMIALQGILANSGFKGSESGTALNSLSNRLYKSTGEGATGRKMLGVDTINADGTVKSFDTLMRDISKSIQGKSEAEINEAFTYLFGEYKEQRLALVNSFIKMEDDNAELVNVLNNVANNIADDLEDIDISTLMGVGAFDELLNEVKNNSSGAVDFKHGIQTDTLAYDLEQLKSAFSGFSVAFVKPFGEKSRTVIQKLSEKLNNLTENAEKLSQVILDKFSAVFNYLKENKDTIISWGSGILAFVSSFIGITKGFKFFDNLFTSLNIYPLLNIKKTIVSLFLSNNLVGPLETLKTLFGDLVGKLSLLLNPFKSIKLAFSGLWKIILANPIGAIAIGIGLLIASLVKLYQNSETFRNKVHEVINNIKEKLSEFGEKMTQLYENKIKPLWEKIKSIFVNERGEVLAIWEKLGQVLMDTIDVAISFILDILATFIDWVAGWVSSITTIFTGIIEFITGVFSLDFEKAWEGIKTIFKGVFDFFKNNIQGILNLFEDLLEGAKKLWTKIKSWFGFGKGDTEISISNENYRNAISTLNLSDIAKNIPHNALGTSYFKGGLTSINERGGELQILPNGTGILPADKTESLLKGNNYNGNIYITIQGNVIGEDSYINKIGERIFKKINKVILNSV